MSVNIPEPEMRAQIDFLSEVKLGGGKKNEMLGRVMKITKAVVTFTGNDTYKKRVRQRLIEEGKDILAYEPKPRPWGVRNGNSPLIQHNDTDYLEFIVENVLSTHYTLDGKLIAKEDIQGFPKPRTVSETSQGGVDKQIELRCVKRDNVLNVNRVVRVDMVPST